MSKEAERVAGNPSIDERKLFHGTDSREVVRGICAQCFDFRMSGKNATVYGKGAYFATTAEYSHSFTKGDLRFMFQACVLVGEYTLGNSSLSRPPEKPHSKYELYDSCVNNQANPKIFIVFERSQSYPEYLIQYRVYEQPQLHSYGSTPDMSSHSTRSLWSSSSPPYRAASHTSSTAGYTVNPPHSSNSATPAPPSPPSSLSHSSSSPTLPSPRSRTTASPSSPTRSAATVYRYTVGGSGGSPPPGSVYGQGQHSSSTASSSNTRPPVAKDKGSCCLQ